MVHRPNIDQKLCFVLMPFGSPFDSCYQRVIKLAASAAGFDAVRSDEIYSTKPIIQDIWNKIWRARVIVADVTGKNANVNYELGICHALGIPTIIITRDIEHVPFDYRHRRCILYDTDEAGWEDKLRTDLSETIRVVAGDTTSADELEWPYNTNFFKEPASGNALIASGDSRKAVIKGAQIVRKAIGSAFGPNGERVAVRASSGGTIPLQRGARIAQGIKSANPLEEKGIEEIRGAASSVFNSVGDHSKLAAILTTEFMSRGQELIDRDYHPGSVLGIFQNALDRVLGQLATHSAQADADSLKAVATTAAHGDQKIGELVFQAMKKAGKDGVISIDTSNQAESTLELFEGMRLGQGYISELFITDPKRQETILEHCYVLVHEKKIQSMRDLLPILEHVAKSGKALLIIAEDVEGEALATLTVNKLRGTLACVAVKCPGYGDRRKHLIEDIAVLTGAKALTSELGLSLSNLVVGDLGKAEKVIVTADETTIIGGGGSSASIEERARTIRSQIDNAPNAIEQAKRQERLAMLVGNLAILRAGGITEADIIEEQYKLESALHSTRAAIEKGVCAGGGIALLRAGLALSEWKITGELELAAKDAIASVLQEPVYQLIENARRSPTQVVAEIQKSSSQNLGFNSTTGQIEDLVNAGVVDAVGCLEFAVQVAFSHARAVLQTGTWDVSGLRPES
jgi:chaperonin GroEL